MNTARIRILIFDACRDSLSGSPDPRTWRLVATDYARNSFIMFASEPGRTANDNQTGENGLFTAALDQWLKVDGLSLRQIAQRTRDQVYKDSRPLAGRPESGQLPWIADGLASEFYFRQVGMETSTVTVTSDAPAMLEIDGQFTAELQPRTAMAANVSIDEPHLVRVYSKEVKDVWWQAVVIPKAGATRLVDAPLRETVSAALKVGVVAPLDQCAYLKGHAATGEDVDRKEVCAALDKYQDAFRKRDLSTLKKIFPKIDPQIFRATTKLDLALRCSPVDVKGNSAEASCLFQDLNELVRNAPIQPPGLVRVTLQRTRTGWIIDGIRLQ
jgi:hypothetical protein